MPHGYQKRRTKPYRSYEFSADQLTNPATGWPITAIAPLAVSTNDDDVLERLFDDTTPEAVGTGQIFVPDNVSQLRITTLWRAETAPGAARTLGRHLYGMTFGDTAGAWSSAHQLLDTDIGTNENYVEQTDVVALGDVSLTAGSFGQVAFGRDVTPTAGTNLTGDAGLVGLAVEFF